MSNYVSASVLTVADICALLKLSRGQFYKRRRQLEQDRIVVEALPRIDDRPRFLAKPIEDYVSGKRTTQEVKRRIG